MLLLKTFNNNVKEKGKVVRDINLGLGLTWVGIPHLILSSCGNNLIFLVFGFLNYKRGFII